MRPHRPIALAGFMGVGKTTIGRVLATALAWDFVDTDDRIERTRGRTVAEIFDGEGEAAFRRYETEAISTAIAVQPIVLALGGGAVMDSANREALRGRALVVHLHVPWARLRRRIPALLDSRPLLRGTSLAAIHRLYRERLPVYRLADISLTLRPGTAEQAAAQLLAELRRLGHLS